MDHVRTTLLSRIDDSRSVFVFPSEVIASQWCEETLRMSGRRAIRADRFISWDTFKERAFRSDEVRRPANRLYRSLFVSSFLSKNRKAPFLHFLVRPEHADNSLAFESSVRTALPGLEPLLRRGTELRRQLDPHLYRDLEALYEGYRSFLDIYHLFEPGWNDPGPPRLAARHIIFFPDVLEDFIEYAKLLGDSDRVEVVDSPPARDGVVLREYANSTLETNDLLDTLEMLLDSGVPTSQIVLTLASLDEYRPVLEREATLREIPLSFRSGLTLADYPPGRFLTGLGDVDADGFGVDSLKAYCLNAAVPWRRPDLNRNLVRFGLSWNVGPVWHESGAERDPWRDAFRRARRGIRRGTDGEVPAGSDAAVMDTQLNELSSHYQALKAVVRRITGARTFRALRDALYVLYGQFLDTTAWDHRNLPVFQSCMEQLSDLVSAEEDFSTAIEAAGLHPYRLWTAALADRLYVPRGGSDGIAVFPYRVSAGLWPRFHFVLGASHESTRVAISRYPFLRDDQKMDLSLQDRDLTVPFSSIYTQSGEHVYLSCSRETTQGAQLAAGYFVRERRVRPAERKDLPAATAPLAGVGSDGLAPDCYRQERAFFAARDRALFPSRLYPVQSAGFRFQVGSGLAGHGADYTREIVADMDVRDALTHAQLNDAGYLRLSSAHMEQYLECPFSYLVAYGLGISEEPAALDYDGAASFGSHYHDVAERVYRAINRTTGVFRRERLDSYRQELDRAIDAAMSDGAIRTALSDDRLVPVPRTRPLFPLLEHVWKENARRLLARLLESDAEVEEGKELESAEGWFGSELTDVRVELFGRVDRITRSSETGGYTLVDYKKNRTPSAKAIRALLGVDVDALFTDRGPAPGTAFDRGVFQIPIYAALARAGERDLERAAYYSMERGAYLPVFDIQEGLLTGDDLDRLVQLVRELATSVAGRVRNGDYRVPGEGAGCAACSVRMICRARYVVRYP